MHFALWSLVTMKCPSTLTPLHRFSSQTKLKTILRHRPIVPQRSPPPHFLQRRLGNQHAIQPTRHEPPYPLRIALVSSSTALCTPCFPAIGLVNLFLRTTGRSFSDSIQWSNGLGVVVSFATWTMIPYNYQIAPLLLPFAIGNGLTAGSMYAAAEGLHMMLFRGAAISASRGPWLAGGIGAMTGYVAPHHVYGEVYSQLYGIEEMKEICSFVMGVPLVQEVSVATGFVAGMALYPMLHFPMYGIPGVPFLHFSALVLLLSSLGLYQVYTLQDGDSEEQENTLPIPLPEGTYLPPHTVKYLDSIVRYNAETGEFRPYSPKLNDWVGSLEEKKIKDELCERIRQHHVKWKGEAVTFKHPILAFLYHYLDHGIAQRFQNHVISVPVPSQVLDNQECMARTDLTAKAMVERRNGSCRGLAMTQEKVEELAEQYKMYGGAMSKEERVRRVKNIEVVSIATDLYLLLKQKEQEGKELSMEDSILTEHLLRSIIKKAPGILLLKRDEREGFHGQSIESQLQRIPLQLVDESKIRERWNEISRRKETQLWKDGLLAAAGFLLSLAGLTVSS